MNKLIYILLFVFPQSALSICSSGQAEGYDGVCVTLTSEGIIGVCWGIFPDGRGPEMYGASGNPGGTYAQKQVACAEACLSRQAVHAGNSASVSWEYIIDSSSTLRTGGWNKAFGISMMTSGRCWCEMVPFADCTGADRAATTSVEAVSFSCSVGNYNFVNSAGVGGTCQSATPCTASIDPTDDGSTGPFYCINGGTANGNAGSCTCTVCDTGYSGTNCHTSDPCIASNNPSDSGSGGFFGSEGRFYCINGGTIGGVTDACTCTACDGGYSGASCQVLNACTVSSNPSDDGSTGAYYCINGGTVSGSAGSCSCTSCGVPWKGDHCDERPYCNAASSPTTGLSEWYYCINGGTVSGLWGSCLCTNCNTGYSGTHCEIPGPCTSSSSASDDGSNGVFYCINGGTIGGTSGSCTCTVCNTGYGGASCQTPGACGASPNPLDNGSDGTFYCINGGMIGGTSGSCTCTSCNTGYGGTSCEIALPCVITGWGSADGSDGTMYCNNGGTVGGTTGSCTCTGCNTGWEGVHCNTASLCVASSLSHDDGANGIFWCTNGGTIGGTTGSCTCTSCYPGYYGAHCQTPVQCTASSDPSDDGIVGAFYCINGGTIGGVARACTCTSCDLGFSGINCNSCRGSDTFNLPGVKPTNFVIERENEIYENFACLRNGNYVCKPDNQILSNFIQNCECKFGFTGPLCETNRMMCILGGAETDGTICECPDTNKQNPRGCCPAGLYWNQDRYSGFSPLQEFREIPNNIFYKEALDFICKPATENSYQVETDDISLKQNNYVFSTTDHHVTMSAACPEGVTEVSMYKSIYKYTASNSSGAIGTPYYIFADKTIAVFSDHNAKRICLDKCTLNFVSKGFFLSTVIATDTTGWLGESNDMFYGFKCQCTDTVAYIGNTGMLEQPSLMHPSHSLRKQNKARTKLFATNKNCYNNVISETANDVKLSYLNYVSGVPGVHNCKNDRMRDGTPPSETPAGHVPNADADLECSQRCARDGFDMFYMYASFCRCLESGDYETQTLSGAKICSIHSTKDRFDACGSACFSNGFTYLNWKDSYKFCSCRKTCTPTVPSGLLFSYKFDIYELLPPALYENDVSIVGDRYDIVYPEDNDNFGCVQTDENLKHVDIQGLDGVTSDDGRQNKVGSPYSLKPNFIQAKTIFSSSSAPTLQSCFAVCSQKKKSEPKVNSFIFKPAYETIDMVYMDAGGGTKDIPLPRCWGDCSHITNNCEAGLTCTDRFSASAGENLGVFGCREPNTLTDQYGTVDAGSLSDLAVCAKTEYQFLNTFECLCTEHDEEYDCNKYTQRANGKCEGATSLGAPLASTDILYMINKIDECNARCLDFNTNVKAFHVKNSDSSCSCSVNYCKFLPDSDYQAFDVGTGCANYDGFMLEMETGLYTEPVENRHPNLFACNIESYLNYGSILDSGECECPLYDFILMYQDTTNYVNLGNSLFRQNWVDRNLDYNQLLFVGSVSTLSECKAACDETTDCTEIASDGADCWIMITSDYFYNNNAVQDWKYTKISDSVCTNPNYDRTTGPNAGTKQLNLVTLQQDPVTSIQECLRLIQDNQVLDDASYHVPSTLDDISEADIRTSNAYFNWGNPTGMNGYDYRCATNVGLPGPMGYMDHYYNPIVEPDLCSPYQSSSFGNNVPSADSAYDAVDTVYGIKYTTWLLLQEAGYEEKNSFTRYRKQLLDTEFNRYCDVGEILEYEEDETHSHANPHYCMQECRTKIEQGFIFSRGDIVNGVFKCFCSETVYDDCLLKDRSSFAQYKVFKYNSAYSSTERLMVSKDRQVGQTKQCKCQGYYISGGEAFSCPENTFKNSGLCTSQCEKCPSGKFSEIGSTRCSQCPAGRVEIGSNCQKCGVGKYATIMDITCQICPVGRFNLDIGQGVCKGCEAGQFDSDSSEGLQCFSCIPGKSTQNQQGSIQCSDCEQGRYGADFGMPDCFACGTGRYGTQNAQLLSTTCTHCTVGKYQDENVATGCKQCSPGQYNPSIGRPGCTDCWYGYFANQYGQTACKKCYSGTYEDRQGSSDCKRCGLGTYATHRGVTSCASCDAGYYANTEGLGLCYKCPSGYYQLRSTHTTCDGCPNAYPWSMRNSNDIAKWDHPTSKRNPAKHTLACDSIWYGGTPAGYPSNFDCAKNMAWQGVQGAFMRRKCWTGESNNCNSMAKKDGDYSEAWTTGTPYLWKKWCSPPNSQQEAGGNGYSA